MPTMEEAKKLVLESLRHDWGADESGFIRAYAHSATIENMGHTAVEMIRSGVLVGIKPETLHAIAYDSLARDCESENVSIDPEFLEWKNKYGPVTLRLMKARGLALTLENAVKVEKDAIAEVEASRRLRNKRR